MNSPAHRFGRDLVPRTEFEQRLERIEQALNRRRILKSPGILPEEGPDGTKIKLIESGGGGMAPVSSPQQRMRIIGIEGDYLTARKQMEDGSIDNNSTLLYIAKPHYLRVTILNGLILDGWTIAIGNPGNTRTLTAGATSGVTAGLIVRQNLNYPYSAGDTIYAFQPNGKTSVNHPTITGQRIDWLDLNVDARNFHQTRIMLNACVLVGGVPTTKTIIFEAGPVP